MPRLIPTKQANNIAQYILHNYGKMQNLTKTKKREIGRTNERIEAFLRNFPRNHDLLAQRCMKQNIQQTR